MRKRMRRWIAAAALAALIALGMTACCRCRTYQRRTQKPLTGTIWQLAQLDGRAVTAAGDDFTLLFSNDLRLSGRGSCNRIMGSWEAGEKGALTISGLAATRMACPDPEAETSFLRMLEGVTHYEMDGPMLMLLRNGELRAVMQAQPDSAPASAAE